MPTILRVTGVSGAAATAAGGTVKLRVQAGTPGPNSISDATTVGTLSDLTGTAYSLLGRNATGTGPGRIPLTSTVRSLLGAADEAAARSAIGAGTPYTLPIAAAGSLGGVRVGSGLAIDPGTGVLSASGGGAVSSVFSRVGAVVAATGDYTASQVTNAADLTAAATRFTGTLTASTGTGVYQTTRYGRAAAPSVTAGSGPNTVIGEEAGLAITTGNANTLVGLQAGSSITNGRDNIVIGHQANVTAGSIGNTVIGFQATLTSAVTGCVVLSAGSNVTHDNTVALGNNVVSWKAGVAAVGPNHTALALMAISSTSTNRPVCEIQRSLINTTDSSYTGRMVLGSYRMVSGTPTFQEGLRIDADSGGVRTSVNGVSAVARQTASAVATDLSTAVTLVNNLRTILINFGVAQA
jgi:hypothetical protein